MRSNDSVAALRVIEGAQRCAALLIFAADDVLRGAADVALGARRIGETGVFARRVALEVATEAAAGGPTTH